MADAANPQLDVAVPEVAVSPLDSFRSEACAWLAANFPPALKGKDNALSALEGPSARSADERAWKTAIGAKGRGVPAWPQAYGGGGLDRAQVRVLQERWRTPARGTRSSR